MRSARYIQQIMEGTHPAQFEQERIVMFRWRLLEGEETPIEDAVILDERESKVAFVKGVFVLQGMVNHSTQEWRDLKKSEAPSYFLGPRFKKAHWQL